MEWFNDLNTWKQISIAVCAGLILAFILYVIKNSPKIFKWILDKVRKIFSKIRDFFKWVFDKIWEIICTVCKWFKIIFTINELEARVTKLKPDENLDDSLRDKVEKHLILAYTSIKEQDFTVHFFELSCIYEHLLKINLYYNDLLFCLRDFSDEYKKNKHKLEDAVILYYFVKSLLKFIKHCEDGKKDNYFERAKSIYNDFCDIFGYEEIRKKFKDHSKEFKRKQEILNLADKYRDKTKEDKG